MNQNHLTYFSFNQRSIVEIRSKKSQFYFHNFLSNIVVPIQANYWKDRMKTIQLKKGWQIDGRGTDRQMDDGIG